MQDSPELSRRNPPGRWLYWLAAFLWLGVPLLVMAIAVPQVTKMMQALQEQGLHVDIPGRTLLHMANAEEFALYVSARPEDVDVAYRGSEITLARGASVFLEDGEGRRVPLQMPGGETVLTLGAATWTRVAVFTIPRAGNYTLVAQDESGTALHLRLLVAGRHWPFAPILDGVLTLLPLAATALVCILLGVGLSMYVYVRRFDARNATACGL